MCTMDSFIPMDRAKLFPTIEEVYETMDKAKELANTVNTVCTNEEYNECVEFNKTLDNAQGGAENDRIRTTS